ncbi:hypothetical protein [Lysinibacillus xylanilyticus]|uniref:hypothetical protein n=1 Tax=Lysinibacillus xylanilyticus TaxID=582475 RepID=UPI003828798C
MTIVNLIIGIALSKSFDTKIFSVFYDDRGLRIDIFKSIAMNGLITVMISGITLVSLVIIQINA